MDMNIIYIYMHVQVFVVYLIHLISVKIVLHVHDASGG